VTASYYYRALNQSGDVVTGTVTASSAGDVFSRIESLGLVPIETRAEAASARSGRFFDVLTRPSAEDVTIFTRDLALLLKAGARINDALDLLANDIDIGRLRPAAGKIKIAILSGESFADAIAHHPALFPDIYVALVRVGEVSGTLDDILDVLANERMRRETLKRKLFDALRYPVFVMLAAGVVLTFFLFFVLPQFGTVLRDFGAKLDPMVAALLDLSDFARAHTTAIAAIALALLLGGWWLLRRDRIRAALFGGLARLPIISSARTFYRTALFCRNLGVLLESGVALTTSLRILVDMLTSTGNVTAWATIVDRVRHGGKLSEALADAALIPAMAVRMLRLGEETGQLPILAGRVADFYEAKLQRTIDRAVGIAGPLAIVTISTVVGGLIVSMMTALLSVSQIVAE
jgi:general secretion pathway protein F